MIQFDLPFMENDTDIVVIRSLSSLLPSLPLSGQSAHPLSPLCLRKLKTPRPAPLGQVVAGRRTPLPGPQTGLLSNARKWIVRGDTCADKVRDFIGKGHPGGEQESKEAQENCSAPWLAVSGVMVMGLISGLSLANHSDSRVFLGGARLVQPRWMPERGILRGGRTCGVSFWPFPNSSGWWRLISSLTRTSCHKTTHANGYYGAWPGSAVSISVLPLTIIGIIWFIMNVEGNFHSN